MTSVVTLHDTTGAEMGRVVDPPEPRYVTFDIVRTGWIGSIRVDGIPIRDIPNDYRVAMAAGWKLSVGFEGNHPPREVFP